ncbi:MAG: tRNA (adenosine(37)-N6)-dimethylallyltransferase MiaA [Deltaproteobacteria bacterium]|nr:tRNA (adenosine(37)-N6)-dimethylallyltransferase MiaA [Deltaproteobacteria bacterium]NIS78314.1 tRNA (adenosine(37)-N6)-dimethylallyltransferase MiaA [Deltaproteobacteria bacterium]
MKKKVVIIGGPTASGKSSTALTLAKRYPLEIVNFDSLQIYRYLDIGTAKPSAEQRSSVPHHLYDIRYPDEYFSVADYVTEASRVVLEIYGRGKIPLFVGGTGLYMRSFLFGLDRIPSSPSIRNQLQKRLEREGLGDLYNEVQERDPLFARAISPNDRSRIVRALEVMAITGTTFSSLQKKWKEREKAFEDLFIILSPERDVLYERINKRVEAMIAGGFVDEVKGLLDMGYSPGLRPMCSLGYRHIVAFLRGEEDLAVTVETIKRETRQYAKRQLTWFKREDGRWLKSSEEQKIGKLVKSFLI